MRRRLRTIAALAAVAGALAACATVSGAPGSVVTRDYHFVEFNWINGGPGHLVALRADRHDGRLRICGAWGVEPNAADAVDEDLWNAWIRRARVRLNGRRVVGSLGFLRSGYPDLAFVGKPAECVYSSEPYQPGDSTGEIELFGPREVTVHL